MTPAAFAAWLAEMKAAGLARTKGEAADLLGVSLNTMTNLVTKGADRRTALACAALLSGAPPYGGDPISEAEPPRSASTDRT